MSYAVLFPGQGSQFVGMGADLFDLHTDLLGERSDRILGWSLRSVCLDGPEETLTRTEFAQPALFALSYALWTSWVDIVAIRPSGAAGHSLGEYTALAAAGVLEYGEALRLVAMRGRLMATAADESPSGMSALLGVDMALAHKVVEASLTAGGSLQIANVNAPGQIVVAGSVADIDWLTANGKDLGVRRSIPLKVAGAFHSTYMASAARGLEDELNSTKYSQPGFRVWANSTAEPYELVDSAGTLVDQITSPVLFEDSLRNMWSTGLNTLVHIGPGEVTAGLARRTLPDAEVFTVSTLADLESAGDGVMGTM
ncbi:MAG TPA: ACP S-malonyltransferase [Acidimicrobiia bacterium]